MRIINHSDKHRQVITENIPNDQTICIYYWTLVYTFDVSVNILPLLIQDSLPLHK